uniref:Acetylcholinesterase tetramerisation domain-containing protein n=1 Tax=Cyprinus carpio TaxID=7962 RepID=A0A8C1VFT2_CYPCA
MHACTTAQSQMVMWTLFTPPKLSIDEVKFQWKSQFHGWISYMLDWKNQFNDFASVRKQQCENL